MPTLSDLLRKYEGDLVSIYRLSSAAVSAKVISGTPVDAGSLRASWTPSVNSIKVENINIDRDTSRRHDIARTANKLKLGEKFSLANGQPYARRIEYEGWSNQAPSGMMRVALAEWQPIVNGAVRGV